MKDCRKLTLGDWIGIVSIVIAVFSFVYVIVSDSQKNIISAIDKVEEKVDKVEEKVDTHVQYHLNNKGNINCKSEELSYAEVTIKGKEETREAKTESVADKRVR